MKTYEAYRESFGFTASNNVTLACVSPLVSSQYIFEIVKFFCDNTVLVFQQSQIIPQRLILVNQQYSYVRFGDLMVVSKLWSSGFCCRVVW
jgi:S-adenosylmethionine:tRNA-ribosyltransferase-isomerase (queuine synthetase)